MATPIWSTPEQRAEAYRNLFTGPLGAMILEDLKRTVGYEYRPTFDPNPYISAFNEGQRAVLVAIKNTMHQADQPAVPTQESEPDA